MRKTSLILLSSAALLALSATGAAAQNAAFNWTGPYVGVNAGYVFDGKTKFDRTTGFLPNNTNALNQGLRPVELQFKDKGFTAGGQIGYNFQFGEIGGGGLVAGLEADLAYTDIDKTVTRSNTTLIGPLGAPSATPVTRVNEYRGQLDALGTVRVRVGAAFDRVLLYGTGGAAFGRVKRETIYYGPNANTTPFFAGTQNGTKTGYAYGGGLEYALPTGSMFNVMKASAVTFKAEYLRYDLGVDTLTFPGVNGGSEIGGYTSRVRTKGELGRVGLNYKF